MRCWRRSRNARVAFTERTKELELAAKVVGKMRVARRKSCERCTTGQTSWTSCGNRRKPTGCEKRALRALEAQTLGYLASAAGGLARAPNVGLCAVAGSADQFS